MTTALILDTDIGGDADDALALALCLRHPEIDLRAVTTVSGDARRRAVVAAKLLRLAGRDDVEVAVGASTFGPIEQRAGDFTLQGEVVVDAAEHADLAASLSWRDAVTLLVEECAVEPLTVATVGSQSNVAAAV